MSDPLWLADVLRAAGLRVAEYPGWRDRGHGDFGNIWGVVMHHTGSKPPSNCPDCIANHPDLGLASQLHLSRDGLWTVLGAGIAWHAGAGSYPGLPANNANQVTIGVEAENSGTEGWSPVQYEAYIRGVAAILEKLGQPYTHAIGHKEWAGPSQGKWDPGGMDMNQARLDIRAEMTEEERAVSNSVWDEEFTNFKGQDVSFRTAMRYDDEFLNEIHSQVARGWKQLGSNAKGEPLTLVDSQAAQSAEIATLRADVTQLTAMVGKLLEEIVS